MDGKNSLEDFILDNEFTVSSFAFGFVFILGLCILTVLETIKETRNAVR